mmetsp:Transcript_54579/g.96825  ORF Transcript_54579/g.96825 Transcript_54579/m.96825 type:complete len:210 (+) Transcript_54579:1003-1632(+)
MAEWWHTPIVLWRKLGSQQGLARMHDEVFHVSLLGNRADKFMKIFVRVQVVNPDATFDAGVKTTSTFAKCRHDLRYEFRFAHERCAKAAFACYRLRRAATIQVHLIVAVGPRQFRSTPDFVWLVASQLKHQGVLAGVEFQKALSKLWPVSQCAGSNHLRPQHCSTGQLAEQETEMPVCDIHHWCYAEKRRRNGRHQLLMVMVRGLPCLG